MLFSTLISLPVLAATVSALGSNYTVPPDFNPGSVSADEKATWCDGEANTCSDVCGSYKINRCDPKTLEYSCECQNGTIPQMDLYINSLPWFICQATFGQCIKAHPDDADGQQGCKDAQDKCGKLNATASTGGDSQTTSSSGSEPTASSTSGPSATHTGGSSAPSHTGAAAVMMAKDYSLGVLATVVLGVFGLML
ncbi:uncharacterized protein GIQ15_04539 [Arthroderma uncinatum]|uniref:uncharacterized protein n=1 Tax=Arthroderma uncinatum TaxID=74035 RepID=UPI00144A5BC0|nr:uncharacterized protein GIQ15_04539 [Arthroderma uncinatum]KAF3481780.1 hypothetical protein GIQ15_04539 [Arthroderma uncinatum]